MPGTDLAQWDPLFKDDYGPAIQNQLNDENQIQSFMEEEVLGDDFTGRQKVVPIKVGRNWSVGSIGAGGALPQQGRSSWEQFKIPIRDVYGRVGFERFVIEQSRSKKGSWAQVIPQEMDGLVEDIAFRRNVMGWLYGSGILARASGAHTAATTITAKDPGNVTGTINTTRYLFGDATSGMFVAFLNPSTPSIIEGYGTITSVNANGTQFTVDTPITCSANALIVMAQNLTQVSYNKEPEGLLAGIDDGTYVATYHNLSRSTHPILRSYVVSGVGALSLDAIQQPIDAISIRVGRGIDLYLCEHSVRRAYLTLLEMDRRYTGADLMSPDGGTKAAKQPTGRKAITYGDIPIWADRDAPFGMMFGVNKGSWVRYTLAKGQWADDEGHVLKWVSGFDQWTAFWYTLENYHCMFPARNFRMEGITVNQLVVRAA